MVRSYDSVVAPNVSEGGKLVTVPRFMRMSVGARSWTKLQVQGVVALEQDCLKEHRGQ